MTPSPNPTPQAPLDDQIEALSSLEHDQWIAWAKTLMEKETLSASRCERWSKLFVPYAELSEEMKEHDRVWARKVLALIRARTAAPSSSRRAIEELRAVAAFVNITAGKGISRGTVARECERRIAALESEPPEPVPAPAAPMPASVAELRAKLDNEMHTECRTVEYDKALDALCALAAPNVRLRDAAQRAEDCYRKWDEVPGAGLRDDVARDNFIEASCRMKDLALAAAPAVEAPAPQPAASGPDLRALLTECENPGQVLNRWGRAVRVLLRAVVDRLEAIERRGGRS